MVSDLMRTLELSLDQASNRVAFVVTEVPQTEDHLMSFLDGAIAAASRHRTPLVEIQLSMDRFTSFGDTYWHVPVTDSGKPDVVRLVFEPAPAMAAA
ncbi:hypothetical protein [uncultured Alsobacter sp.]|uniref:hypothetical protein n=1 Tax=uncultured Alsobacter sp. TaxID=1748258 RepID=UPI0025FEDE0F|nr:hypothetical protein [uncultured Alsobacter sp.]